MEKKLSREAIVAGQFYPDQKRQCVADLKVCLKARELPAQLPETIVAGIVPHAGWMFSGAIAGLVFSAIKKRHTRVETFVIFGAAHGYFGRLPAVFDNGLWQTPLGEIGVDSDFARKIIAAGSAVSSTDAHRSEHSIEVQVPFIQHLWPESQIVPIITPPGEHAIVLGESVAAIMDTEKEKKVVVIGSTDLTHYGPHYGFEPMGMSADAFQWATRVNDRKFIDLALALECEKMLTNAAENCNACGPGAAAAAVAAARKLGEKTGTLLAHTNSSEIMLEKMGMKSQDSVGYAAIVF